MKQIDEKTVHGALEKRLSALTASPALSARIRQRVAREEEPNMKKKLSLALVLAAVLLLGAVSAVAAGIVLSRRVDAELLASRALESAYGVTPTMQGSYFGKTTETQEDGSVVVTYWGIEDLRYVLGEYTVRIKDGQASVTWSRDGESTEGGFDAEAWGVEQLNAMVAWSQTHHDVTGFYGKAVEIARRGGAEKKSGAPSEEEIAALREGYLADSRQAHAAAQLKEQEMIALAREAVAAAYGLTKEQMALTQSPQDVYEPWEYFHLLDGRPVYSVWLYLTQRPGGDPDVFPEFTEGDGIYVVDVNVETGVIESIRYDSGLGGNG